MSVRRSLTRLRWLPCVALLCATFVPAPERAHAHTRPLSYSYVHARGERIDVRIQLAPVDLALLGFGPPLATERLAQAGQQLQRSLQLSTPTGECTPLASPALDDATPGWHAWSWSLRCSDSERELRVHAGFAALLQSGHRHLVRFERGSHSAERVLELAAADWTIDLSRARPADGWLDFVALGVEHLLTGWDHLAFVLALLLLATRLRDVVLLVTSFTLAHSLSLALAVLGVMRPQPAPVEALIGFSIALLGVENCWLLAGRGRSAPLATTLVLLALAVFGGGVVSRSALVGLALFSACHFALLARAGEPAGLRIAVAFAFGLIHGLGFAAVMAELSLPASGITGALFGFNLGVELGQLAVVLLAWPALRALSRVREGRPAQLTIEAGSAAVAGLGLFWFVSRAFS